MSGTGIREVFTSGSEFERLTAQYLPDYFNCSNDDKSLDDRSGKKGPEAESVAVGQVERWTYALWPWSASAVRRSTHDQIPLDVHGTISTPASFAATVPGSENDDKLVTGGVRGPRGLAFVSDSSVPPENRLLAACEVSGTWQCTS